MSTPPPLYCPFRKTPAHPEAERLVQHELAWTQAWQLAPNDAPTLAKVRSYSLLAASCYPSAPFDRLAAICDYYSWLFFFDDACEDLSLDGGNPGEVAVFLERIYRAVEGGAPPTGAAARFVPALRDIWERISPACSSIWQRRLRAHVANYIDGCVWEAQNRLLERVPSRAVYTSMRMFTSTMYEFWDFIEYAGGFELPDAVVEHPILAELQRSGNAVASYANDIYSMRKETENRDFHNLVMVLRSTESLSLAQAYDRAVVMHDEEVRNFQTLECLVPSFGAELDRDVARYIEGMRIWMRANYDWSIETPRYASQTEHVASRGA